MQHPEDAPFIREKKKSKSTMLSWTIGTRFARSGCCTPLFVGPGSSRPVLESRGKESILYPPSRTYQRISLGWGEMRLGEIPCVYYLNMRPLGPHLPRALLRCTEPLLDDIEASEVHNIRKSVIVVRPCQVEIIPIPKLMN